ncbi:S1 RNA-binding domain-containing protein [Streptomyces sp. NPDC004435]|uniref:S1 RNA-binding domain-containing protein n=1 Tax=Streptomyces sp. NPDC004435 TaxID=3364701 RepID=UPI0036B00917
MGASSGDQGLQDFPAGIQVGDVLGGTVAEVTRTGGLTVTLDGFAARPVGTVSSQDIHWAWNRPPVVDVGHRITAQVIAVDPDEGEVRLAMTATRHPELWAFLAAREPDEILSGTVTAIERFGVFVALDEGPAHPVFPGVGFISMAELSWRRVESVTDVVLIGQPVSCEFLQFDTWNGEARLSLKATQPDPFDALDDSIATDGRRFRGVVTKRLSFGVVVRIADGVEGLIPLRPVPEDEVAENRGAEVSAEEGDEVTVVVTAFDRARRRVTLRAASSDGSAHHAAP